MTKKVLGAVTIGQAPRTDLVPEFKAILGSEVEIREAGALDDLSRAEIEAFAPTAGDYVLVTRLADGSSVKVAEKYVFPRLKEKIANLFADGMPVVILLCTGEFPDFPTEGLLVRPQPILYNVTAALVKGLKLGVICPAVDQITQATERWQTVGRELVVEAASPYGAPEELTRAAEALKGAGVQIVVMDCMGYTLDMQKKVKDIVGVPVILARGIVARVVQELL